MMTMIVIQTEKAEVVKYLVHALQYYKDKYLVHALQYYKDKNGMLIIPYNTGSHWVLLTISMSHDQVWYYDSNRPTNLATGK
jgi:DNA-binding phage protein